MRWFGVAGCFSLILWGPGMRTRKVNLAAHHPASDLKVRSGQETARSSPRCSRTGSVFQGAQMMWLLWQGMSREWPGATPVPSPYTPEQLASMSRQRLECRFVWSKTSPGEGRSYFPDSSLSREAGENAAHSPSLLTFPLPAPSRKSCFNCSSYIIL